MKFRLHDACYLLLAVPLFLSGQDRSTQLSNLQKESPFVGFAVSRIADDEVDFMEGFGHMRTDRSRVYSTKTIQPVASVSKTFVGLALMKAVELGYLTLDDPVQKYLTFKLNTPYDEPILVRHLVTHTSGIRDRWTYYRKSYVNEGEPLMTLQHFLFNYFDKGGDWYSRRTFYRDPPGQSYHYSNVASALLAHVIDKATNIPFTAFCSMYIFDPLGMNATAWYYDLVDPDRHTDLHKKSKKVDPYSLVTFPDGGLRTNVEDLSRYLIEMMKGYNGQGSLLTKENYRTLFEPLYSDGDEHKVAVFWGHRSSGAIGHTGGDPGVSAFCFFYPDKDVGKILLVNGEVERKKEQEAFRKIWAMLD